MTNYIRALLAQYTRHTNRGNMIDANRAMIQIVSAIVDVLDEPCQCACGKSQCACGKSAPRTDDEPDVGLAPEGIEDPDLIPTPVVARIKRKVGRPRKITTAPQAG